MAEKMGYRPDPMLASLVAYRRGKHATGIRACLGWLNLWDEPEALRRFKEFDNYWTGAHEAAERLGYHLEEFRWTRSKSGARLQTILETRGIRGLLIPPHRDGLDISSFDWSRFSIIRFGASVTNLPVHTVTSDQSHCARLAFEKAFALGYRRIGYISESNFDRNTSGHFREGYLNAQAGLASRPAKIDPLILDIDSRRHQAEFSAWFQKQKPDAVLSTVSHLRALTQSIGLRVPKDLAVATSSILDGNFDAGADQNSHEIGRVAVSTLAGLILENERGIPRYQRRILVEGRWVDGESMPPKARN